MIRELPTITLLSEQREIHTAILTVLHKVWMSREVVVFTMLQNEDAAGF